MTAPTRISPRRCGSSKRAVVAPCGAGLALDRAPQRVARVRLRGGAHLLGETGQHALAERLDVDVVLRDPAVAIDRAERVRDELRDRERREQRDDVGEGLVEGELVRQAGLEEAAAQAVEDGVGRLVGDDVVRQARVDRAAPAIGRRPDVPLERAEQDAVRIRVVVGVRLAEGAWHEGELVAREAPWDAPAEGRLERGQRP